jgi:hypothetical protein
VKVVGPALAYFALVFGAGFVLGPIRVGWLVPQVGARYAELIELPVMAFVVYCAARWVVRRWRLARGPAFVVGGVALSLMVAAELGLAWALQRLSPLDYVASRDVVAGPVYAATLLWFGGAPAVLARVSGSSATAGS